MVLYDIFITFVKEFRMTVLNTNLSVFVKLELIIIIYINNLLIMGSWQIKIAVAKYAVINQSWMSDLWPSGYFL